MACFLETDRLCLRNLRPEDAAAICRWRNDIRCSRFQRWEATSQEAVRRLTEKHRRDVFLSEQEEQRYAICTRDQAPVGDLTLFYTAGDCITLGITVAPEYQRKGIAREILSAVIGAARVRYPALELVALVHPENTASRSLFEGLGFRLECYAASIDSCVYVYPVGE